MCTNESERERGRERESARARERQPAVSQQDSLARADGSEKIAPLICLVLFIPPFPSLAPLPLSLSAYHSLPSVFSSAPGLRVLPFVSGRGETRLSCCPGAGARVMKIVHAVKHRRGSPWYASSSSSSTKWPLYSSTKQRDETSPTAERRRYAVASRQRHR